MNSSKLKYSGGCNMKRIENSNIRCGKNINEVFKQALEKEAISKRSDYLTYINYVEKTAKGLLYNIKTKRSNLIKVSACLIGYAQDQYPDNTIVMDLACDIVNEMAKQLDR